MDDNRRAVLKNIEQNLGYFFHHIDLLDEALTHRSYTHEVTQEKLSHNERMEFLGDAVLNLTVSDLLMRTFPCASEGILSRKRAACVNERTLAYLGTSFRLGESLLLGKGEENSGGRKKSSLLADALEAVIAAIYLDGGYDEAASFVSRWFQPLIQEEIGDLLTPDYKSMLQEWCQARFKCAPHYTTVSETGPDHDKTYVVTLQVQNRIVASGTGRSRKEAEKAAAKNAYDLLNKER